MWLVISNLILFYSTVYANKLEKHLKICNSRSKVQPPYIVSNVNRGVADERTEHRKLSDLTRQELASLIEKINHVYDSKYLIKFLNFFYISVISNLACLF